MKRALPIGIEFYKQMIEKDYYYVDKTLMIKDLLRSGASVSLFTRPRRFGKTLALSMLKTFFEDERDRQGNIIDNSRYFEGTKISCCGEAYMEKLGKYPVISLSLKSAKQPTFEMAYNILVNGIRNEFRRHWYVYESGVLFEDEKEKFKSIMEGKAEADDYATAIAYLSECLEKYHGKKTIILIDEYDVPLENSYFERFYDKMIAFIRSLFESALKTNNSLEFAVVTGCLRIGRESIFTGLNNLEIISVLNKQFAEHFGFTQSEVEQMLADYKLDQKREEIQKWYDGYLFGDVEVYNPWSVVNYVKAAVIDESAFPRPYWANTSSNSIVKELVELSDSTVKKELEDLIVGGSIEKPVHEEITYGDIHQSQDNLWNFLLFTGYLKVVSQRLDSNMIYLTLKIPNEEIRYIYQNTIREWFERRVRQQDFTPMYQAMLQNDPENFEQQIRKHLSSSISYFDSEEDFYHGFLLGLLRPLQDYEILSNRESGAGRPDIVLKPYYEREPAVILEIKHVKKYTQMENGCAEALKQMEDMEYEAGLLEEGFQNILKYGICFCRKSCMVR